MHRNGHMRIHDVATPVVVLGLFHHAGLSVVRSLGRMGIRVYGVDPNHSSPGLLSRYCHERFVWDLDNAPPTDSIRFLMAVAEKIGVKPLLMPTTDETLLLVERNAGLLRNAYIFPDRPLEIVEQLSSKKGMYHLAKAHGIPTAETRFPTSRRDVEDLIPAISFPVMLKGIEGSRLIRRIGRTMKIVRTPDELLREYDALENPDEPNLMVQEYLPGGDDSVWMFNGYFNNRSECLVGFTGRKIRQAPVYTGYTSLGMCSRNDTVTELTLKFMTAVAYRGILDIGFRFDARDGLYKVLDINPRIGATFRLFTDEHDLDVARAQYLDLTGQQISPATQREGRKWFVEDRDLLSSYQYHRDGKLTVREWIRSFHGVEESAWYAVDDMLPFWMMWVNHVKRSFSKIMDGKVNPYGNGHHDDIERRR